MKKLDQRGFHLIAALLIIVVVGAVGFAGWRVFSKKEAATSATTPQTTQETTNQSATPVTWQFNGNDWVPSSTPPKCSYPLVFPNSPVDVSKATAILYPGQTRGTDYKPHGGFRFDGSKYTDITVKAPMNARLVLGSRYTEAGEVQYLLEFTNDCGVSYRFDHLYTLSPKIQAEVEKLPAAKQDDSRTTIFESPVSIEAGETIATAVGFAKSGNVAVDFGVYDLRKRNQAAGSAAYAAAHQDEISQAGYALCWFDLLPGADAAAVKALPGSGTEGKTSDYCK